MRLFVLLWVLGCSAGVSPSVASPPPHSPPPASAGPPVSDSAPRADARILAALRPILAEELPGARILSVGAGFAEGRAMVEGAGFTLAFDYSVNPVTGRVFLRRPQAFEGVRYLEELEAAGVSLRRTGRRLATAAGPLACRSTYQSHGRFECLRVAEPEPSPATLERPNYLRPPSEYARPPQLRSVAPLVGPRVDAPPLTDVLACHPDFEVTGVPLDEDLRALLVTTFDGAPIGAALCVTDHDWLRCTATELDALQGVVEAREDHWLLLGDSGYGSPRSRETMLVSIGLDGPTPTIDTLGIGAMTGYGEACPNGSGYCVWVRASSIRTRLVTDACIERLHEGGWTATHQRGDDRWVDEVISPREEGPCIERYGYDAEGFERTGCGPASTVPRCPADVETLTAR